VSVARRGVLVAAALVALTARGPAALAENARVALLRPSASTPAVTEAMTRIRGELVADGFDVIVVDSSAGLDSVPSGAAGQDTGALATIELVVDAEGHAAELRVMDRLTNKTVIRRTTIEAPEASKFARVLAVRAVELLRASLLELLIQAHPRPAVAAPPAVVAVTGRASQWAASALDLEDESTWGVDAGTAVLVGFEGIGPALLGVIRIRRRIVRPFEVRATIAGLGTEPRVQAAQGRASVSQEVGLLEVEAGMLSRAWLHPVVSLGAGLLYMAVEGQPIAASPYLGERSSTWAFAADVGTGLELRLSDRFHLSLEGHAFVMHPYPVIRFLGDGVARTSEPSLLGTLTAVGWL
jgi:hypothetical protein